MKWVGKPINDEKLPVQKAYTEACISTLRKQLRGGRPSFISNMKNTEFVFKVRENELKQNIKLIHQYFAGTKKNGGYTEAKEKKQTTQ